MIWKHKGSRKDAASNIISKIVRPLFESHRVRVVVGTNLAAAIVIVRSLGPIGGNISTEPVEIAVLSQDDVKVITEKTFRFPIDETRGYSQGFRQFHPGVDIRVSIGSDIHPVAAGTVTEVEMGKVGYGHRVVVQHDGGMWTLYAHMDKVSVKVGDQVTKQSVLGTVGLTGWTTGPHLHFEVHSDKGAFDPKLILPELEEKHEEG